MVDFFISYLKNEKRASVHTVKNYTIDLAQFQEYLQHKDIEFADTAEIRSWIAELSTKGLENTSINRKITCLKAFYKLLLKRKKIDKDPSTLIKPLKTKKSLPIFLEEKHLQNLFESIPFEKKFKGYRDQLILELLYGTGIRLSELIGLKITDIDHTKIKVLGKRSKYRIIPIYVKLAELLALYLQFRPDCKTNHLLLTDKLQPIYPMFVQRKVNNYLKQVSTLQKTSPHILRHTFATHLLNKGADLNAIKELLGHANLSATQIYTHNSISKLKEAYAKAHPKA